MVNGRNRIRFAAQRQGWTYSGLDINHTPDKMMWTQTLHHEQYELMIEIDYSGFTIKSAVLTDVRDNCSTQILTAQDRDKAARIEDVLLGNGRRF